LPGECKRKEVLRLTEFFGKDDFLHDDS
jgi:hypothetical protein